MTKDFLQKLKEKLEKEKALIEAELGTFAKKDKKVEGDWDTVYPKVGEATGANALEEAADAVEEYSNRLPVEFSLENRLKDINLALGKLKKGKHGKHGKYGKCENCKKPVSMERLKVYPEARTCNKCK